MSDSGKRHQCYECDWVYNQAEGWLEDGIAAGTSFEDINVDWSCPDCGAEKSAFLFLDNNGQRQGSVAVANFAAFAAPAKTPAVQASKAEPSGQQLRVWECIVCGWVYDEAKGWPEDGIAPGTRWEDIPADWLCPECGVGKSDFEMVVVSQQAESNGSAPEAAPAATQDYQIDRSQAPLVIIGTGMAAYNLAREWRKLDQSSPLLMVTRDDGGFYSKPQLSTGYTKLKRADQLLNRSAEEMALELAADIRIFSDVSEVSTEAKTLCINSTAGQTKSLIQYQQLVFATGANCIQAPLEGDAKDAVYQVNDLLDYQRFRTAVAGRGKPQNTKVLIIGGGLIGSEYANDLANGGYQVEAVEAMDRVLGTLLPPDCSYAVQQGLAKLGVSHHFNTVVESVNHRGGIIEASLSNGGKLTADIILSAIGVRANTQLAADSGLAVNRGIVTDRQLRTSAADVYALGDCAEVDGQLLYFIEPLMQSVRALAKTLTGDLDEVCYGVMPVTIKTPACPVVVCPAPRDAHGKWKIMGEGLNVKAEFIDSDGQLRGFALTGAATDLKSELAGKMPPAMDART